MKEDARPENPGVNQALREGARLYNEGQFFECHEVLEEAWLKESGPAKDFLQGLIKIAAGFHHYQKGTYRGMLDLLTAGRDTLLPYQPTFRDVELRRFLEAVRVWIGRARRLLEGGGRKATWVIPPLVLRPDRRFSRGRMTS